MSTGECLSEHAHTMSWPHGVLRVSQCTCIHTATTFLPSYSVSAVLVRARLTQPRETPPPPRTHTHAPLCRLLKVLGVHLDAADALQRTHWGRARASTSSALHSTRAAAAQRPAACVRDLNTPWVFTAAGLCVPAALCRTWFNLDRRLLHMAGLQATPRAGNQGCCQPDQRYTAPVPRGSCLGPAGPGPWLGPHHAC